MKRFLVLFISLVCLPGLAHQKNAARKISEIDKNELIQYLNSHWESPEDYIVGKFKDFDIIFIGECHQVKHDVELIHNLIPRLYKMGVYNLGIEFGCYEYQDRVDSLVTAETYNEDLARWLVFKWGSYWPYKEYMDIYKKVWEFNKSLSHDEPKFRVVNLDYRANWNLVREGIPSERWKRVFFKGDRDAHMSRVIFKEFVNKNKKTLIYAGQMHAGTHYYEPDYDFEKKILLGFKKDRMGNLVFRQIPDKVFNICLHYPWPTKDNLKKYSYPVAGVIDSVMKEFREERIGFDVKDSPFEKLRDDTSYYSTGYDVFTLGMFCDGYVFQRQLGDYEGCTVDPLFITEENFKEAIDYLPNPRLKKIFKTPQDILRYLKRQVNLQSKFRDLE